MYINTYMHRFNQFNILRSTYCACITHTQYRAKDIMEHYQSYSTDGNPNCLTYVDSRLVQLVKCYDHRFSDGHMLHVAFVFLLALLRPFALGRLLDDSVQQVGRRLCFQVRRLTNSDQLEHGHATLAVANQNALKIFKNIPFNN